MYLTVLYALNIYDLIVGGMQTGRQAFQTCRLLRASQITSTFVVGACFDGFPSCIQVHGKEGQEAGRVFLAGGAPLYTSMHSTDTCLAHHLHLRGDMADAAHAMP